MPGQKARTRTRTNSRSGIGKSPARQACIQGNRNRYQIRLGSRRGAVSTALILSPKGGQAGEHGALTPLLLNGSQGREGGPDFQPGPKHCPPGPVHGSAHGSPVGTTSLLGVP